MCHRHACPDDHVHYNLLSQNLLPLDVIVQVHSGAQRFSSQPRGRLKLLLVRLYHPK